VGSQKQVKITQTQKKKAENRLKSVAPHLGRAKPTLKCLAARKRRLKNVQIACLRAGASNLNVKTAFLKGVAEKKWVKWVAVR
jgi:hypothetical protein